MSYQAIKFALLLGAGVTLFSVGKAQCYEINPAQSVRDQLVTSVRDDVYRKVDAYRIVSPGPHTVSR